METFKKQYELDYYEFDSVNKGLVYLQYQAMKEVFGHLSIIEHKIVDPRGIPNWLECENDELEYLRYNQRVRIQFTVKY